ncbi:MAG TPA: radical SAM protein [Chitinispirillaceae bacterium]|nr:radical SAM protein [Chitinispirillaceae bacterium]
MSEFTSKIFGPVPSRRLGRSLGIDIIPFKTCTYDCIYCQLGKTTNKTDKCTEFCPVSEIVANVEKAVKNIPEIDYLTLSGSGEPLLHSGAPKLIDTLKKEFNMPVAVLTNGSLLFRDEIADNFANADVVMPTLAADCERTFEIIHRPHQSIKFDNVIEGIIKFSNNFDNELWLEIFLIEGINSEIDKIKSIKTIIDQIEPLKVQVNTVTRPASDESAVAVNEKKLSDLKSIFGDKAEIITEYSAKPDLEKSQTGGLEHRIVSLLERRPCTEKDIVEALLAHKIEVIKILEELINMGIIETRLQNGIIYYLQKRNQEEIN